MVMVDSREMNQHIPPRFGVGAVDAGEPIVPMTRLVEDVFPVGVLAEDPFHGVLFDVAGDVDFGVESGQSVGVSEDVDDPLVDAAEEEAGVETADVFGGEDLDVGKKGAVVVVVVGRREERFPRDVGIEDQSVGIVPATFAKLCVNIVFCWSWSCHDLHDPLCSFLARSLQFHDHQF